MENLSFFSKVALLRARISRINFHIDEICKNSKLYKFYGFNKKNFKVLKNGRVSKNSLKFLDKQHPVFKGFNYVSIGGGFSKNVLKFFYFRCFENFEDLEKFRKLIFKRAKLQLDLDVFFIKKEKNL